MSAVKQLVRHIAVQRHGLRHLEEELHRLQTVCTHEYRETLSHRECRKCMKVESIHY